MRWVRSTTVLGLATAALLAAALPATAALGIELAPGGAITKRVDAFTIRAFGGEVTITCRLTLRGQLSTRIVKATARRLPEGRIGRIETAVTEGCRTIFGTMAEVTILPPFSLRYEAFQGTLPEITGIIFRKLAFALEVIEPIIIGTCLFSGPVNLVLTLPPVEGGAMGRFNPEAFEIPNMLPDTTGGLCPESVQVLGAGRVQAAQTGILVG